MKIVHFLTDPAVNVEATYPIYQAFSDILVRLHIREYFELHDLGSWKAHHFQNGTKLIPFKSVSWFLESAYNTRVDKKLFQLNTQTLLADLQRYCFENRVDYVIFITDKVTSHPNKFIGMTNGATTKYRGAVISVVGMNKRTTYNLCMHEFGHLFGLVLDSSRPHLAKSHCNVEYCIMKPFITVQDVVQGFDSFCPTCLHELNEFVKHVKTPS